MYWIHKLPQIIVDKAESPRGHIHHNIVLPVVNLSDFSDNNAEMQPTFQRRLSRFCKWSQVESSSDEENIVEKKKADVKVRFSLINFRLCLSLWVQAHQGAKAPIPVVTDILELISISLDARKYPHLGINEGNISLAKKCAKVSLNLALVSPLPTVWVQVNQVKVRALDTEVREVDTEVREVDTEVREVDLPQAALCESHKCPHLDSDEENTPPSVVSKKKKANVKVWPMLSYYINHPTYKCSPIEKKLSKQRYMTYLSIYHFIYSF